MSANSPHLPAQTCLHVCVTCRHHNAPPATDQERDVPPAGRRLYDALRRQRDKSALANELAIQPVLCLANCDHGCSLTISSHGKWAYLLGRLDSKQSADIIDYARTYTASPKGAVLRSKRPASLARAVVGRFPMLMQEVQEAAE